MKIIITAGNSGAGLMPLSSLPVKSLEGMHDTEALLPGVYKLALSQADEKHIFITSDIIFRNEIKKALTKHKEDPQLILEPADKGSAFSAAAALNFMQGKRDDIALIMPADIIIKPVKVLSEALENAKNAAKKGFISVLGVNLKSAESGKGYIKTADFQKKITKAEILEFPPDNGGNFENLFWNTGIYVSKISVLLEELEKYAPETAGFSKEMFDERMTIGYEYYENLPEMQFEEVMHHSDRAAFIELKAKFQSCSSWSAVYDLCGKNPGGCVKIGNSVIDNASNSLVYSDRELTAVSHIQNMTVVNTKDMLLVYDNERTADIGRFTAELKKHYKKPESKTVRRPWGVYTCLNKGGGWLTRIITVYPFSRLTMHSHEHRSEHWVVLDGEASIISQDEIITLQKGESINIPAGMKHSLQNNTDNFLKILEVQKGSYISEDDIIRYAEEAQETDETRDEKNNQDRQEQEIKEIQEQTI